MNRKYLAKGCCILITLLVVVISFFHADAQTSHWVTIDSISNTQFPGIEAHVSATNVDGFPIQGLNPGNFSVLEDSQKIGTIDVTSFLNTEKPLAIALVIDTSGSMNTIPAPSALQNVVQSAKAFVAALTPNDNVAVISFSETANVVQDLTTDKTLVNQALDSLQPVQNTALYEAIVKGVDVLKNRPERRIIILLTDGTETTGNRQFTFDQAASETQKWSIPVYPIGFGQALKDELQKLATISGGALQMPADTSALQGAFTQVLQILRQQYKITYTSTLTSDGKGHTLLVGLDYQDRHDEVSRTFIAQLPTTIQIKTPLEGDVLKDNSAQITADVYALTGVSKVDLLLDGQSAKTFDTQPYEYQWDLTNIPEGSHTISMVLTAKDGSTANAQVKVQLQKSLSNTGTSPVIWLAGLMVLAVAAVLIPVSLRSRRQRGRVPAGGSVAAAGSGTACLRELEGMHPGQVWPLGLTEVHLGRKREENDIPLQGLNASRKQAVIRCEQGQYVVYNITPTNPTIVNGTPVQQAYVLQPGDTLRLGETVLRYEQ